MIVRFAFIFERETTVGHVVEVLQPFEEGDGDTSGVDVEIGDDQDVAVDEDLVRGGGRRTVGRFSYYLYDD